MHNQQNSTIILKKKKLIQILHVFCYIIKKQMKIVFSSVIAKRQSCAISSGGRRDLGGESTQLWLECLFVARKCNALGLGKWDFT